MFFLLCRLLRKALRYLSWHFIRKKFHIFYIFLNQIKLKAFFSKNLHTFLTFFYQIKLSNI